MRHRQNKTFNTGNQKRSMVIRSLLTNLIQYQKIKTTSAKASILLSTADSFIATLVSLYRNLPAQEAKRKADALLKASLLGDKSIGQKFTKTLLPQLVESDKSSGFVSTYKLGRRKGDGAEQVLVKIATE